MGHDSEKNFSSFFMYFSSYQEPLHKFRWYHNLHSSNSLRYLQYLLDSPLGLYKYFKNFSFKIENFIICKRSYAGPIYIFKKSKNCFSHVPFSICIYYLPSYHITIYHLYIPQHNYASLKRMPLFNFPRVWNLEGNKKLNPVQHRYLKYVKNSCLVNLN